HGHYLMTAGDLIPLTVRATDTLGNTVSGYGGTVHFSSTDVQAGLPADYTFRAADGGVHTFTIVLQTTTPNGVGWSISVADAADAGVHSFSLTLNTSGNQTLSVVDVNNSAINASTSGSVNPGAASTLAASFPTATTAGVAQPFTVTAIDSFGNPVTSYTGTVTF